MAALGDAVAILATTPGRLRELVAAVPAPLLERPPKPGEWSAVECINHLANVESLVIAPRFRGYLEGATELTGLPDTPPTRTAAAAVEAFAAARERNLQLVGALSDSDLERTARHPRWGEVSFGTHIQEWAAHDLNHLVQAERALIQPFIVASGSMRPLFEDLDVS